MEWPSILRGLTLIAGVFILGACGSEESRPLTFVDASKDVGIDVSHSAFRWDVSTDPVAMMGGGLCWIDIDNDGWLDLFVTDTWSNGEWGLWNRASSGRDVGVPTSHLLRNSEGTFTDVTAEWGASFEVRANGCAAADLDNDGFTDLYVTTERENLLLWNEGGTGFVEGAEPAGVESYGWSTGIAIGDVNNDGAMDLVVAGYADLNRARPEAQTGFPNTFEPIADVVYLNSSGGHGGTRRNFTEVDVGLEPDGYEYGLGVVLIDFDADGDLDLHVANDTQPNRLYRNDFDGTEMRFTDISATSGLDDPNSGMGIATTHLDGDGLPEVVVTNLAGQGHVAAVSSADSYLYSSDAISDVGIDSTGWGASFGDFDNDGDADLLLASGDIPIVDLAASGDTVSFLRNTNGQFTEESTAVGLGELPARNARSIAVADYDNDGDLDAAVSAIGEPLALLQNQTEGGSWLIVDPGTPVPGMRLQVETESGLTIDRVHTVGGSWLSSEDPRVHIGLGDNVGQLHLRVWSASGASLFDGEVSGNSVVSLDLE